jgi:hypothetical protein
MIIDDWQLLGPDLIGQISLIRALRSWPAYPLAAALQSQKVTAAKRPFDCEAHHLSFLECHCLVFNLGPLAYAARQGYLLPRRTSVHGHTRWRWLSPTKASAKGGRDMLRPGHYQISYVIGRLMIDFGQLASCYGCAPYVDGLWGGGRKELS